MKFFSENGKSTSSPRFNNRTTEMSIVEASWMALCVNLMLKYTEKPKII